MERQARRKQVLQHAKRIFARKGYHHTNIADIVARARIARGTFYLYFRNKKDLFEELLEQVLGELRLRIQRLRLGPFSVEATSELLQRTFDVDAPRVSEFAERLHRWTGGNPFFIDETIKASVRDLNPLSCSSFSPPNSQ